MLTRKIRTILISAPWRLADWPSLPIAQLKSYVRARGFQIGARHLHLEIACELGIPLYQQISQEFELGEGLYSSLLYPSEKEEITGRIAGELQQRGKPDLAAWLLSTGPEAVRDATLRRLETIDLSGCDLVGFSLGAIQLMGSLYMASVIKATHPRIQLVFGGSAIVGEAGAHLMETFPFIDHLVDGPGEEALLQLIESIQGPTAARPAIPGLWRRDNNGRVAKIAPAAPCPPERLPVPDFEEYFCFARESGFPPTRIVLPLEASRGCQWEHRCGDGKLNGCSFCGLYRNSPDYLERPMADILAEIRLNTDRYQNLNLSFVDAYLPSSFRLELLRLLRGSDLDVSLFCEMRCDLDDELGSLLVSTARRIQLGVEAFSDPILKALDKGRKTIDNLNSMKICEELGISYQYNILSDIPGITPARVREMAAILPSLSGFRPPSVSKLVLDRGSRMYQEPEKYGIDPDKIDAVPLSFLSRSLGRSGITQSVSFEPLGTEDAAEEWREVASLVDRWRSVYDGAKRLGFRSPLYFREGGGFLSVVDNRFDGLLHYTLEGELKAVLLATARKTSIASLPRLLSMPGAQVEECLRVLEDKQLLFRDGLFAIALPIRERVHKRLFEYS